MGLFLIPYFHQNAKGFYNKGIIYVGTSATGTSLYIQGDLTITESGSISHAGKTVLTGDFVNNVTSGNVFTTRSGTFEFKGSNSQRIYGTADKAANFIKFPEMVIINNQAANAQNSTVRIDPDMGATMKNLTFTRGRLVLDSKTGNGYTTNIAHLLAETGGTITYKHNQTNLYDEGIVQVNLSLGENYKTGRMVGFSPPFKNIYADYFFFNFLAQPDKNGFFIGTKDFWIKNPKTRLPAGRGYVLGQGLVPWGNNATYPADPYYLETRDPQYSSALPSDAIRDTFVFARKFAPPTLKTFVEAAALSDRYTGEELNTSDVHVSLAAGEDSYVYLGNPYTTPLDLSELANTSNLGAEWGTSINLAGKRYYILSEGKGNYLPNKEFEFTVNSLVAQASGATAPTPYHVAPMQMFAVERTVNAGAATFIIPASKRTHGNKSFLRSDTPQVTDELLIETKDGMTGGYDRLCLVFRNNATLASTDMFDAPKLFNRTGGVNQIYTLSSDNKELTTNVIPSATKKLVMYFEPARQAQEVILKADRLNSITSVGNIVLEDVQTGKLVDLKKSPTYRFISSYNDKTDRFVLHFDDGTVGLDLLPSASILRASYETNAVWVYGVRDNQIGSTAFIYDLLGNLLHQQTVTEVPFFRIDRTLEKGIYIIRLSGEASVARFAVK
jgi:hypothetical protein